MGVKSGASIDSIETSMSFRSKVGKTQKIGTRRYDWEKSNLRRRPPPGCVEDTDRHGNVRIYIRREGAPKVPLRGIPWTTEFMEVRMQKRLPAHQRSRKPSFRQARGVGCV